jgi:sugar phosphate isomerase/epimerase
MNDIRRRSALAGLAAGAGALATRGATAAPAPRRNIKLGFDNFAVRAFGWKAPRLVDYAAELKTDSLFITDLDAFESLETPYLRDVRKRAADAGLQIHLGTWSVCPTSGTFKATWGTAEQHLALAIRVAHDLGSPVARVVLGNMDDRKSPGGIDARVADTVKVLKANRSRAKDAGVKIAVENHAGDLQSHELAALVEAAGKDYVGVNIDTGNALWAMEDPLAHLERLAPYVVTTSLRDGTVWESDGGATVQWAAMGDGMIDFRSYVDRFEKLCPGVPVHIETISGLNRELPYLRDEFWAAYPKTRAADFARFVALARRGKPRAPWQPPAGKDRKLAEQEYQKREIERSLRHCKDALGLGLR